MSQSHPSSPIRIAVWSGPRNISTAMMRSFENRPDTQVVDEPFYAFYLSRTGLQHPARDEILKSQSSDWRDVVDQLLGPLPDDKTVLYQKLMSHHMLEEVELEWMLDPSFRHIFLIRSPEAMLVSLGKVLGQFTLEQTGLPQQTRLFDFLCHRTGTAPLVIDARDVLQQPKTMLGQICDLAEITFCDSMLNWPPGPRDTDGVWGPHWYQRLYQTTSFRQDATVPEALPASSRLLLGECQRLYDRLAAGRIAPCE